MSIEDWLVRAATASSAVGRFSVEPTYGGNRTAPSGATWSYTLRHTIDLVPSLEERLARIDAGRRVPRLVRVAVRRTFAEIDRLRKAWEREAQQTGGFTFPRRSEP